MSEIFSGFEIREIIHDSSISSLIPSSEVKFKHSVVDRVES